mgnify:CR=1 FL=1
MPAIPVHELVGGALGHHAVLGQRLGRAEKVRVGGVELLTMSAVVHAALAAANFAFHASKSE